MFQIICDDYLIEIGFNCIDHVEIKIKRFVLDFLVDYVCLEFELQHIIL